MACILVGIVIGIISDLECFKGKEKEIVFEFPQPDEEE
jgi:hypothetical protein